MNNFTILNKPLGNGVESLRNKLKILGSRLLNNWVFTKESENSCTIIMLYVDNSLIFAIYIKYINETKNVMSQMFEEKDLCHIKMLV